MHQFWRKKRSPTKQWQNHESWYLWIRFCNVGAACAVRRAGSSQRRAGHIEHLPWWAEISFCETPHVQIRWQRFYGRDSGCRRRQARDVYWAADTQQKEILEMSLIDSFRASLWLRFGLLGKRIMQKYKLGLISNPIDVSVRLCRMQDMHIFHYVTLHNKTCKSVEEVTPSCQSVIGWYLCGLSWRDQQMWAVFVWIFQVFDLIFSYLAAGDLSQLPFSFCMTGGICPFIQTCINM